MADIAAIFHWPLSDMAAMDVIEVIEWRGRAVDRWKKMNEVKGGR
jgi:hypothetical protein